MGLINVEGLGQVEIQGEAPTPVEMDAIMKALSAQTKMPPQQPIRQQPSPLTQNVEYTGPAGVFSQQRGTAPPDTSFMQDFGDAAYSPETFRMLGGTLGSAVGLTGGGVAGLAAGPGAVVASPAGAAAGGIAGAALGEMAGQQTYNTIESLRQLAGLTPDSQVPQNPLSQLADVGQESLSFDVGARGLGALGRFGKRVFGRTVLGTSKPEAQKIIEQAAIEGVPVGGLTVSPKESVKGVSEVLGVFPFVGTKIKRSQLEQQANVISKFENTLNSIAPYKTIADAGIDLTDAAKKEYKSFRNIAGAMYGDYLSKAEKGGAIFPVGNTKQKVADILQERQKSIIPIEGGDEIFGFEPFEKFVSKLSRLPDKLTGAQVKSLSEELNQIAAKARADGYDIKRASEIRKGLESDFHNPDLSSINPDLAESIVQSRDAANQFFAENIKRFQTATAQKFGRADKNIFSAGFFKAGTKEADEAFKSVFNAKSPQALQNLRSAVGDEAFNTAARRHLQNISDAAFIVDEGKNVVVFDPSKLKTSLGLDSDDGRKTLEAMLSASKVAPAQIQRLSNLADAIGTVEIPNVSQFIARRATLGGTKAVANAFQIGTGVVGAQSALANPVASFGIAVMLRNMGDFLSNPRALQNMLNAFQPNVSDTYRRSNVIRALRLLGEDENQEEINYVKNLNKEKPQ